MRLPALTKLTTQASDEAISAVGVRVLANVTDEGVPFGGILTVINFTAPDGFVSGLPTRACPCRVFHLPERRALFESLRRTANGTMHALASIRTLDPCASSAGFVTADLQSNVLSIATTTPLD